MTSWAVRLCALIVVSGLLVPLSGCGNGGPPQAIRFGLSSAPITLDPRMATDATSARINRLLYARLVDFDAADRPAPALAHWQLLSPTHYRFVLGSRAREFTDGTRLTAADVKATYDSVLDPATGSAARASLAMVDHIQVVDADTVDFYLKHPDPLFPGYLVIGIVPAHALAAGHSFERSPIGSGPFRFLAWPNENRLRLVRRADHQEIDFITVTDATVRVLKLLRGEIDLLQNDLPQELVGYLSHQKAVYVVRGDGDNFTYLGFNLKDPALSDLRVRKAIAHAIDRADIVRYLLGKGTRLAAALLPPHHWAGNPALKGYSYDLAAARALLAEAGYGPGHPLALTYKTSNDPMSIRIATIIQHQLALVGIQVSLKSYDWATFYADIKAGRFQLYSLSWVGIKSPDIFRYVFYSTAVPPKGANRGRYADAQVDRLIDAADASQSLAQRSTDYRRLQARLLETLPYVPLWYEENFYAARRDVTGYRLAADGNYDGLIYVHRSVLPAGTQRH
jgi:peptide/nickel transport system substrate-binding protein